MGENFVCQYYRFYGARHSTIHLGFKINYEEQDDSNNHLPKIRNILHLHDNWLLNNSKFFIWQQFIKFLHIHLRDTFDIEPFYFDLLNDISKKLYTQNAKRAIIEGYISILKFEGRFSYPLICTNCHKEIIDKVTFLKELKPFHANCLEQNKVFNVKSLEKFFILNNSFFLDDNVADDIFSIIF